MIQQQGRPLAFYSQKLTDTQIHYTFIELKLLTIVETQLEYQTILLGHIICIYTDHKNLTFSNFTNNHVCHWRLIVEEYGLTIIYFPGTKNVVTDFLSCQPFDDSPPPDLHFVDELFTLNDDDTLPLDFDLISKHKQADTCLQTIACNNLQYEQCILGHVPIIYYQQNIITSKQLCSKILS